MAINNSTVCSIPGCGINGCVRGLCRKHYMRQWKTGSTADRRDAEERFWSFVNKRGPDECWPWLGTRNRNGHGQFSVEGRRRMYAHVFSWILVNGRPLPADRPCGLHRCDNPPCCNPAHVFPGTNADNIDDRHRKGRDARGDGHGMTKIPESEIPVIRARAAAGERYADLAAAYGVAKVTIASINRGIRRKQVHAPSVP